METAKKVQAGETNFYPAIERDAKRYRWLRQMDRADAWSSLLAPNVITRTEDIDEAIDAAMLSPNAKVKGGGQ